MSAESVARLLSEQAPDIEIVELDQDSSTYTLAADWGIEPAQIAKALAMRVRDDAVMVVTCGDARLDNKKIKAALGGKAKMLDHEEAAEITGHEVGGVCALALASPMRVYFDYRLRRYTEVVPGAGTPRKAFRIHPDRMAELVGAEWVDVCQGEVDPTGPLTPS